MRSIAASSLLVLGLAAAAQAKTPAEMTKEMTEWWVGRYDNQRQVAADAAWLRAGEKLPELVRDGRRIVAVKLDAPQLGENVIYFEEHRDSQPGVANRQRVTVLKWDENAQAVRSLQYFFKAGPAYERKPIDPAVVAKMKPEDFLHQAPCDLYFKWDEANGRYKGGMLPRTCTYEQGVDGVVYAEFDMVLWPDRLWYRDRSKRVLNDSIRGEIDGFNWLRFDEVAK
jgi:hypothetical protein